MRNLYGTLTLCVLLAAAFGPRACLAGPETAPVEPGAVRRVSTSSAGFSAALASAGPPRTARVDHDVVYGGRDGRYRGRSLVPVLRALFGDLLERGDAEIVFVARDGYTVGRPLRLFSSGPAFLAEADEKAPPGSAWRPVGEGREIVSPAPYMLVWEGDAGADRDLPWPHQIIEIRAGAADAIYGAAYPAHRRDVADGFESFRKNCAACHSVNLTGGVVGPELNVPMNVTEYWSRPLFSKLVRDPGSVRAGSRMPRFASLPGEEIDRLYDYLAAMRGRKTCDSAEECRARIAEKRGSPD